MSCAARMCCAASACPTREPCSLCRPRGRVFGRYFVFVRGRVCSVADPGDRSARDFFTDRFRTVPRAPIRPRRQVRMTITLCVSRARAVGSHHQKSCSMCWSGGQALPLLALAGAGASSAGGGARSGTEGCDCNVCTRRNKNRIYVAPLLCFSAALLLCSAVCE